MNKVAAKIRRKRRTTRKATPAKKRRVVHRAAPAKKRRTTSGAACPMPRVRTGELNKLLNTVTKETIKRRIINCFVAVYLHSFNCTCVQSLNSLVIFAPILIYKGNDIFEQLASTILIPRSRTAISWP